MDDGFLLLKLDQDGAISSRVVVLRDKILVVNMCSWIEMGPETGNLNQTAEVHKSPLMIIHENPNKFDLSQSQLGVSSSAI